VIDATLVLEDPQVTVAGADVDVELLHCWASAPVKGSRPEIIDRNNPIGRENRPATAFLTLRREARQQSCASYTPHLGETT
jgi:hypothetical protein